MHVHSNLKGDYIDAADKSTESESLSRSCQYTEIKVVKIIRLTAMQARQTRQN